MPDCLTATSKQEAQAKETELVPEQQRAMTSPGDWPEVEVGNMQGWQQVVSPTMRAGKSRIKQRNKLAQDKGRVWLIHCGEQGQAVEADCSGAEQGACDWLGSE